MELLLLCAGAGDKSWAGPAADRPLRTKGKRRAQKVGALIGQRGLRPDITLTALDNRSRVTAEKTLKAAGWTARDIRGSRKLSAGRVPDLPDVNRVLLTAPSATIQALTDRLGSGLRTHAGGLLIMSLYAGNADLKEYVDPRNLPDLFPWPSPDGPELRPRPAYYYTQSAALPYRKGEAGTEILIVGSSSGRHWVVPKGIVEPGLGPAQSALIEAREEAGVEGMAGHDPLGHYTYDKWGAACSVAVYAMEVTRVLPDDQWEENHRDRRWVSPVEAADLLHQPAFRGMLARL